MSANEASDASLEVKPKATGTGDAEDGLPAGTSPSPVASSQQPPDGGAPESDSERSGPAATQDETPASDSQAADTAAQPASAPPTEGSTTSAPGRGRVRLNPSKQDDIKAIPSIPTTASSNVAKARAAPQSDATPVESLDSASDRGPGAVSDESTVAIKQQPQKSPPPTPPPAPVEIPSKIEDLDADLEAEINAALSQADVPEPVIEQDPEAGDVETTELESGTKLKGTVQTVGAENVFVELGFRSPGILQVRQFESRKLPKVGQSIEVIVDRVEADDGLVVLNLPQGRRKVGADWSALAKGQTVDCMVTKTNKGGLEVTVGSLRGFLPAGQVDLYYVSDLEPYVGQKLTVQLMEVNARKRNLVVSRRAHLEVARKEAAQELWKTIAVGQKLEGCVKTLKDYGAFIDLGGADGFLHIGEISWQRVKHPSDALQEGQQVEVSVLQVDAEKKKISLGMRQLTQNPWLAAVENYPAASQVSGTVTRTSDFGAFVELEPGIEGLIHISELDYRRVKRVTDVLKEGQQVDAQVLEVDPGRRRISLSLKALKPAPESEKKSDEDLAPSSGQKYERKRKTPLKGGTGGSGGGGLFGNPVDFGKK